MARRRRTGPPHHVVPPLQQGRGDLLPAPVRRRHTAAEDTGRDERRSPALRHRPRPGGGLTSVAARHDSPRGTIESRWERHDGGYTLHVRVPPGTEAQVHLPGAEEPVRALPGTHVYTWAEDDRAFGGDVGTARPAPGVRTELL
ncbi:alpha-L-rhamnosidase C-terminal domain-containing protein [Streptomyces sp. NPDC052016]|uniref:alpha-L-rhamnosidase C-terminal domain-containing protein n=1 Tax=Streptomyces sp. NPDC052016 TaxID=3365680 RepID=UPI0037CE8EA9